MANTPFVILGTDGKGNVLRMAITDSGLTDSDGHSLYQLVESHGFQTVSPPNQASTSAFVDFAGSQIDSAGNSIVTYTLLNTDAVNGLSWQVLASNDPGFAASVVAQASANIAALGVGTFTANPALYRYYKVQIKDQVGGSHATGQLAGIARG